MGAFLLSIVHALGSLVGFAATETARWVKQEAMRLARAARALIIWMTTFSAARAALVVAAVAAFEVFSAWVTSHAIVPLASGIIHTLIPEGSSGDGIVWVLWDTGLHGREAFRLFVLYVANYTLLWKAFSTWLQVSCISLATYRTALRTAKVVRESSV